jgi:DNA-binding MarR family transcriptional regulator
VPPRAQWPTAEEHTRGGRALTELILATFRANGALMEVAQRLASEGGITAAWWQVLGGVLDAPRSVAEVGRVMGMTRQSVQRVADVLVEHGLAEYRANPNHRRAKLLAPTEAGRWAIRRITLAQHPWANEVGDEVGPADLERATKVLLRLVKVLEAAPGAEG